MDKIKTIFICQKCTDDGMCEECIVKTSEKQERIAKRKQSFSKIKEKSKDVAKAVGYGTLVALKVAGKASIAVLEAVAD